MRQNGLTTSIPWYDEENYFAVLSMLPESEREDAIPYPAFKATVEDSEKDLHRTGHVTHRVPIDAVALKHWCNKKGLQFTREAIGQYGVEVATAALNRAEQTN